MKTQPTLQSPVPGAPPQDQVNGALSGQDGTCPPPAEHDEAFPIPTPPPRRVFSVRVRYRHAGPGQPFPLRASSLDDGP